ncbi:MAG: sensor histidine kinase, partial [Novosphingobium sp.]
MAVLPFRPTPFFANKDRAFWQLQIGGWGGAMVLRAMTSVANEKPLSFLALVLIATITGFSISLILSVVYRQLINRRPLVTWGLTAIALAIAVSISAFVNGWVISLYQAGSETSF